MRYLTLHSRAAKSLDAVAVSAAGSLDVEAESGRDNNNTKMIGF